MVAPPEASSYYRANSDLTYQSHTVKCTQEETDYCHNVLENTEQLQEQLYREMRGRIQEADESAPVRWKLLQQL